MKKAIVLGATGLIGGHLLHILLDDEQYSEVTIFVRKKVSITNPKLQQIVLDDFHQMDQYSHCFHVDDVFCCLGTTIKKAKTKERFKQVDFTFPFLAASIAKQAGAQRFLLVSSMGANVNSRFFYNRIKGEVEKAIDELGLPTFLIFRPSLLLGKRSEFRFGERLLALISQPVSFLFIGRLQKYRPIQAKDVAAVMHRMAQTFLFGTQVFENDQIYILTPPK
jgi:uncharacterized protein YbjT (DUF2867 family)